MILAAVDDTAYNIVLLLHILAGFAAFAPAFIHPLLGEQAKALDDANRSKVMGFMVANGRRLHAPALVLVGVLGFALPGMSAGELELSQGWLVASIVVWLGMNGVLHAVVIPGERAMAEGDNAAESRVTIGSITITLLLVVMLYLMIWKPGL
ncbi:MAG: hypothetical protein OEW42_10070 [Acidimicrobiia bacterium]|nr:hypothetical protein [Acidimicrobiia bacterium]MDH5236223.1 hypothetical protein [Acidimicrobiia bacterium]